MEILAWAYSQQGRRQQARGDAISRRKAVAGGMAGRAPDGVSKMKVSKRKTSRWHLVFLPA